MFTPISKLELAEKLHKENPAVAVIEWEDKLTQAEDLKNRLATCNCGNPIWIVGTALVEGPTCHTCLTGSADCTDDFEIEGYHEQGFMYGQN
jgi:hypothetical protein